MKKVLPLKVRRIVESNLKGKEHLFKFRVDKESTLTIYDADTESEFYFTYVEAYQDNNSNPIHRVWVQPRNSEDIEETELEVDIKTLEVSFEQWCNLIVEYNQESSVFNDSISQSYYDELEPNFKIVDEDADVKPFSIEQQKVIVQFLNRSKKLIAAQKKDIDNAKEVISLIEEAKRTITRCTKSEVVRKIRKIIAKGFKVGLQVGEKLLIDFSTELAKKLLTGGQ